MKKKYRIKVTLGDGTEKLLEQVVTDVAKYMEEYGRTRQVLNWELIDEQTTPSKALLLG